MVWLAILVSFTASSQLATNVTVTNLQGKIFHNITLDHTNMLGVVWVAPDGGMGQFRYTDLPMEYWDKLNLSNSAQQYIEAIRLKHEREQQEEAAQREAARQQADAENRLNNIVQDELSASNSEEQIVDAMPACPTNMTSDETTARDGTLKALLDISSATGVGVNRNDYGNLLTKATSALAFGKTKLTTERHQKFLTCAEKALHFYSKANDNWSDYFQHDWEREQDEMMMGVNDFYDLRVNGVKVDASNYRNAESTVVFYVPFKESLILYWQAADIYVHKMQRDSQH
jgi:hypothetical protein